MDDPRIQESLDALSQSSCAGEAAWQRAGTAAAGLPRLVDPPEFARGLAAFVLWEHNPDSRVVAWSSSDAPKEAVAVWCPPVTEGGPVTHLHLRAHAWDAPPSLHITLEDLTQAVDDVLTALLARNSAVLAESVRPMALVLIAARLRLDVPVHALRASLSTIARLAESAALAQIVADHVLWMQTPTRWRQAWLTPPSSSLDDAQRVIDMAFELHLPLWDGLLSASRSIGQAAARSLAGGGAPPWGVLTHPPPVKAIWRRIQRAHNNATWPHRWNTVRFSDTRGDRHWERTRLAKMLRVAQTRAGSDDPLQHVACGLLPLSDALAARRIPPRTSLDEHALALAIWRALMPNQDPGDRPLPHLWSAIILAAHTHPWRRHPIPKRSGELRWLDVPPPPLATALALLRRPLIQALPSTGIITAFLPGRGPAWHALAHQSATALVVVDIHDFFGSIRPHHLNASLTREPRSPFGGGLEDWSEDGRDALTNLVFLRRAGLKPYLPQGSPASPAVANLAALPFDFQVLKQARRRWPKAVVTRYADDVVISVPHGASEPSRFAEQALTIIREALTTQGWHENQAKTRTWTGGDGPMPLLCGIRPPSDPDGPATVSRVAQRRGRAARHRLKQENEHIPDRERKPDRGTLRARGTAAYLYSATGHPGWLAWTSTRVRRLAERVVGPALADTFQAGWDSTIDGSPPTQDH